MKKEKQPKTKLIKTNTKADGSKEVIITKAPQHTIAGKIIVGFLAVALAATGIVGLIIVLCQL